MSTKLDEQIIQLKQTIADIESQRSILGDEAVEASLKPIRKKLADLQAQAESQSGEPIEVPQRKRKLVTLLYMDVVGSTAMTQDLDPEDTMDILDKAILRLAAPVEAHGGHVTRYTGDGFKAIFGDPISREDDPEQSIRAGLEILDISKEVAKEIEKEWGIEGFQVRIGIDTGLAAIGGETEAEDTVKGRVVNLAVRIESAAPPGGLLISHNTYRHVRGVFNVEPQEPIIAKGFPEAVAVYLVESIKPRAFRVLTRGVEGVETRMVGRESDLKFLQDALMTALEEGEGQVVTISGEAGVGKSRLLYEFENWIELLPPSQDVRFFQGRGRPEAQGLPYSLLRDMFAFRFQILDDDSGEQVRHKIEIGFCDVFGGDDEGVMRAHILGQLLGFDFSASPHLKGVLNDAEQLRNRGVMYLIQYFRDLSQGIPAVIFLEDIHWGDDSSLDLVNRIGEFTPQHPILFVCAARPVLFERRPYWGEGQIYHTLIELRPLSKRESRQLVGEILKLAGDIPTELRELVVVGAEGNPFYTEELIKMLIEDGVVIPDEETWQVDLTRLEEVDVPSTLAGVLQARLDSLPAHERRVLQQASVVGRLFWDRIVAYIQAEGGNGADLKLISLALISLRERELVYRHEESAFVGAVEYLFKHDVLREVTYESVLKRLRKTYHGLVADWLIANCGDRIGEYSGLIAEHLLLADRKDQSIEFFQLAGESALSFYANKEAEMYFRKAIQLNPSQARRAACLAGLGETLVGQGRHREIEQTIRQAIELYHELGEYDQVAYLYNRLSWGVWFSDYHRAWNTCQEGLARLMDDAISPGLAYLLAEAGRTAFFSAQSKEEIIYLCNQAIEMADRLGIVEPRLEATNTLAIMNDDALESIDILQKTAVLSEMHGLLRRTSQINNNIGYLKLLSLVDAEQCLQHFTKAAEIRRQIGDIDFMMMYLWNVSIVSVSLGKLYSIEAYIDDFLRNSCFAKTQIEEQLQSLNSYVSLYRGKWVQALVYIRNKLQVLHEGKNVQEIVEWNRLLVSAILELHRFGGLDYLAEAEAALFENITMNWAISESYYLLAFISARKIHIQEAQEYQTKAPEKRLPKQEETILKKVEYEIARVEEHWDESISICQSLINTYHAGTYRWEWARQLIDLGDAYLGRDGLGDLERARETYQQSLDMFTEMGAPGYIKVLEERIEKL